MRRSNPGRSRRDALQIPSIPHIPALGRPGEADEALGFDEEDDTLEVDEGDILEANHVFAERGPVFLEEELLAGAYAHPDPEAGPEPVRQPDEPVAPRRLARLPSPSRSQAEVEPIAGARGGIAGAMGGVDGPGPGGAGEEAAGTSSLDLGVSLREQGSPHRAVAHLERALGSGERPALCHMTLGLCHMDLGKLSSAISAFKDALFQQGVTEQETTALHYELGRAYERREEWKEALYYYGRVIRADTAFRDTASRIVAIRKLT